MFRRPPAWSGTGSAVPGSPFPWLSAYPRQAREVRRPGTRGASRTGRAARRSAPPAPRAACEDLAAASTLGRREGGAVHPVAVPALPGSSLAAGAAPQELEILEDSEAAPERVELVLGICPCGCLVPGQHQTPCKRGRRLLVKRRRAWLESSQARRALEQADPACDDGVLAPGGHAAPVPPGGVTQQRRPGGQVSAGPQLGTAARRASRDGSLPAPPVSAGTTRRSRPLAVCVPTR
jgi:hypothetical protein